MASRIVHLAVAKRILEKVNVRDKNRFLLGVLLPDAYGDEVTSRSHFKITICGGTKKTYDLSGFRDLYKNKMKEDSLYLGYYLHLIQDAVYRKFVYDEHQWNPLIPGNVERLHRDYQFINPYVINKYQLENVIEIPSEFENESINKIFPFGIEQLVEDLKNDFSIHIEGEIFFFTENMADEFIERASNLCLKEIYAFAENISCIDEYLFSYKNRLISLLETTENTRELGGYRTKTGKITKGRAFIRSDVQKYPSEKDISSLLKKEITTVIDMRSDRDIKKAKSGFEDIELFQYYHCPIEEGSGVPESVEAVPSSYMEIASAKNMKLVFEIMANTKSGVMFNCSAGKDRTGVVSAILLSLCGVDEADIIENYVATREYGKGRLEMLHKNFPDLDMNIVIPNERTMKKFLELFYDQFGDAKRYLLEIGLVEEDIQRILDKLV